MAQTISVFNIVILYLILSFMSKLRIIIRFSFIKILMDLILIKKFLVQIWIMYFALFFNLFRIISIFIIIENCLINNQRRLDHKFLSHRRLALGNWLASSIHIFFILIILCSSNKLIYSQIILNQFSLTFIANWFLISIWGRVFYLLLILVTITEHL